MTAERWNTLTIFEQMSNISGEVTRLIQNKQAVDNGNTDKNYTDLYIKRIMDLIYLTLSDPKNQRRERELLDEFYEIERYIMGDVDADYISDYWEQYTKALG